MNRSIVFVAALMFGAITISPDRAHAGEKHGGDHHGYHRGEHHGDDDELACYKLDRFPAERIKIDVKRDSRLSEKEEQRNFHHPKQIAYSVHGKEIGGCGAGTVIAIDGTVIVARSKKEDVGSGASMGVEFHAARQDDRCRSVTFDCTSDEVSATPNTWFCFIRNDFGIFWGPSTLIRVDEGEDPLCSVFQDKAVINESSGPATGLRQ